MISSSKPATKLAEEGISSLHKALNTKFEECLRSVWTPHRSAVSLHHQHEIRVVSLKLLNSPA